MIMDLQKKHLMVNVCFSQREASLNAKPTSWVIFNPTGEKVEGGHSHFR